MKNHSTIVAIFLIFPYLLFAQNMEPNITNDNDKIIFEFKYEGRQKIKKLIFPNNTLSLKNNETANVSPNGKLAAVLNCSALKDRPTTVCIYNEHFEKIENFEVVSSSRIYLADDGRFAVVGSNSSGEGISNPLHIWFYTKEGVEVPHDLGEFGLFVSAVFAEHNDIMVVAGIKERWPREFMHAKISIYDNTYKKIGGYNNDVWSGYSQFNSPIIDSDNEVVKILVPNGGGESYRVDTIFIDYSGNLIER